MSRPLLSLLGSICVLLTGCQTAKNAFPDTPEPWKSNFQTSLLKEPDSKFALACHGDPAALHEYFGISAVALDPMRAQTYNVTIYSIYQYLGRRRFLAALAHETPEIRQAMIPHVPYYR